MKTTSIVRSQQGAWRWQTPYRIHYYQSSASVDGVLRWRLTGTSAKLTWARARTLAGHCRTGGLHRLPVVSNAERDSIYSNDDH